MQFHSADFVSQYKVSTHSLDRLARLLCRQVLYGHMKMSVCIGNLLYLLSSDTPHKNARRASFPGPDSMSSTPSVPPLIRGRAISCVEVHLILRVTGCGRQRGESYGKPDGISVFDRKSLVANFDDNDVAGALQMKK